MPNIIIEYLEINGFSSLTHIRRPNRLRNNGSYWYNAENLGLQDSNAIIWNRYIEGLKHVDVHLIEEKDLLLWEPNHSDG